MKTALTILLFILVLVSLALNGILIAGLFAARQGAVTAIDEGLATLSQIEQETIATSFRLQQTVPVTAVVPIHREMSIPVQVAVPVSEHFPLRQMFEVPIKTAVGSWKVAVPVSATIPVSLTLPISVTVPFAIDETIPISTEVEVDVVVPISIPLAQTPLPRYLDALRDMLIQLRDWLTRWWE